MTTRWPKASAHKRKDLNRGQPTPLEHLDHYDSIHRFRMKGSRTSTPARYARGTATTPSPTPCPAPHTYRSPARCCAGPSTRAASRIASSRSKVRTDPDEVQAWIDGESQPTRTKFNAIVSTLRRPSAAFFLPEPPQHLNLPPPLRRSVGSRSRALDPKELREIRWARRLQQLVAHLRPAGCNARCLRHPPVRAFRLTKPRRSYPSESS